MNRFKNNQPDVWEKKEFTFNVGDHPNIEAEVKVTGVPSILFVNSTAARKSITLLEDPPFPNEVSYYTFDQLKNFLNALSPEESQK